MKLQTARTQRRKLVTDVSLNTRIDAVLLPYLPRELIKQRYRNAPGNELARKFVSPESSAALAANAFGLFLRQAKLLDPLPGLEHAGWPAMKVLPEEIVRFPWQRGRHPCLDVLIETKDTIIGIESKYFEPYRTAKRSVFAKAYSLPVWGRRMERYERLRDDLAAARVQFKHLDAGQLVKHAFGLRTAANSSVRHAGKRPILCYLYAEPGRWPNGRSIGDDQRHAHREEISRFERLVAGDEVEFLAVSYASLIASWAASGKPKLQTHASALRERFEVGAVA